MSNYIYPIKYTSKKITFSYFNHILFYTASYENLILKDKKNTTNSNETSENNNNFEQLIKQQDIDLANLEKKVL